MRLISLNKVTSDRPQNQTTFSDTDEVGENQSALASTQAPVTVPVSINVEAIRCFYPRRNDAPGTRITFTDGGGFAVSELYADVVALVGGSVH